MQALVTSFYIVKRSGRKLITPGGSVGISGATSNSISFTFFFLLFFSLLVDGAVSEVSARLMVAAFSIDGLEALPLPLPLSLLLLVALPGFPAFFWTFSIFVGMVTDIPFFVIT